MLRDDAPTGFSREERRRAALGIFSPVIAVAIGTVAPAASLVAFVLLPVFSGLTADGLTPCRRATPSAEIPCPT